MVTHRDAVRIKRYRRTTRILNARTCLTIYQEDHPAHHIANEMAFQHNAILRGLNAIYLQAPHVPSKDAGDFTFFMSSWAEWVIDHHKDEDENLFPAFESVPGVSILQHNVEQHKQFMEGLSSLHKYATSTPAKDYSGIEVQTIINGFAEPFRQHLADEIDSLWAMDCVKPGSEDCAKLLKIFQDAEKQHSSEGMNGEGKHVIPPMIFGLCDKTYAGANDWPKIPKGSSYLIHYVLGRKHRGAWRFLPCDAWRTPRPLHCMGEGNNTK